MAISRIATEVQMGEPSLFSQEMFLGGASLLQLPYLIFFKRGPQSPDNRCHISVSNQIDYYSEVSGTEEDLGQQQFFEEKTQDEILTEKVLINCNE